MVLCVEVDFFSGIRIEDRVEAEAGGGNGIQRLFRRFKQEIQATRQSRHDWYVPTSYYGTSPTMPHFSWPHHITSVRRPENIIIYSIAPP